MVEFIRDVVIVLALLITLMAIALNPSAEAEIPRKPLDQRSALANPPGSTPSPAQPVAAPASPTPTGHY